MPGYGQTPASGDNQEKKVRGQAASLAGMGLCGPKRTGLLQVKKAFPCKGGWCVNVSMRGDKITVKFCCLSHSLPLSERFSNTSGTCFLRALPRIFPHLFPERILYRTFPRLFPGNTHRAFLTLPMINFVLLQMQNRTASCMETLKSYAMINMLT